MKRSLVYSVLVFAGVGCASQSGPVAEGLPSRSQIVRPSILTIVAVDYSKSTEGIRSQLLSNSHEAAVMLDPKLSQFLLYRFGHEVEEAYSGEVSDEDELALLMAKHFRGSDPVPGTNYPKLFEELARAARVAKEERIRIIVCGDALNDFEGDPALANLYRRAVKELAENNKVELVRYWGVALGNREELRRTWTGCADKLQIASLDQPLLEE